MLKPGIPANEDARMAALRSYDVLDSDPEPQFDALTRLAAHIAGTSMALVTLVDTDRQWFKARYGMDATETPRDVSLCAHVVASGELVVIEDARRDVRFADNPIVAQVSFYAGTPLRTADGHVLGTLCALDPTPLKITSEQIAMLDLLAQQVVALLEARRSNITLRAFRTTLDQAPDAIMIVDAESMRYEYVNESAARQAGYSRAELMACDPVEILPERERDKLRQTLLNTLTAGHLVSTFETIHCDRDGNEHPVEVVLQYIPSEATRRGRVVSITRDISERKRVELLQAEFVSTVSHELRTPLTSIYGSLGLVAGGHTGELPPEAKEFVEIARTNSERLVRLINDILDVEKMQSGKLEFRIKSLPLQTVLGQALEANEGVTLAGASQIVTITPVPDLEVAVDPDRFTQAITNLISNAAKFSPPGSQIEVATGVHGDNVRISVRDHGPGIPASFRDRVFQRFAQAESASTRQTGGTGLGLNISKTIVERLGGTIRFEDAEGEGTRFVVELPALPRVVPSAPNGPRILVIEDDPGVYRMIVRALRPGSFATDIAPTLERARRLLAVNTYDAVTLDLALPDGEGSDLLDDLAKLALPVIVVSGSNHDLGRAAVFVTDVISKPFREERLLDVLKRVVVVAPTGRPRILHVEDDADLRKIVRRTLPDGWDISGADSILQARRLLADQAFDAVVIDLGLPDGSGADLIAYTGSARVIIFSAQDVNTEMSRQVNTALVKTRSTAHELRSILSSLVGERRSA